MDSNAFHIFIENNTSIMERCQAVIMDNLSAHDIAAITLIEFKLVLGSLIYLLTHQILIQLNIGGHNLKLFYQNISPKIQLRWLIFWSRCFTAY
jgi:hypothetical protein